MTQVKNRIDAEMDLLRPVGPQGLFSEDWSKNTYNDNRFFRADGDWSNAGGKYSVGECKNICESLFARGSEKTLREACKSTCKSKCTWTKCEGGYKPTRESVCLARGLSKDCTEKDPSMVDLTSTLPSGTTKSTEADAAARGGKGGKGSLKSGSISTGAKIGIGVAIVLVAAGTIWYFKTRKK